jgi:hypothetical protein
MIDNQKRTPLEAYKETGIVSKYLKKDSSGHYWESHELSLIGAATIDRPYGTPLEKGSWEPPVWIDWWRQWEGFGMRFADPAVPAEWRVWPGRCNRGGDRAGWGS